jgi:hypothetical protein
MLQPVWINVSSRQTEAGFLFIALTRRRVAHFYQRVCERRADRSVIS